MFKRIFRRYQPPPKVAYRLQWDHHFLRVFRDGVESEVVRWCDVATVLTWKEDLWAVDCIWVGLFEADRARRVLVNEEMSGFCGFLGEFDRRFPDAQSRWYFNVMVPAFEENLTVIWRRGERSKS